MKNICYPWLAALLAAFVVTPAALAAAPADLEKAFVNPPEAAKPGVLWMWMGCNLSKAGITRDLEALKAAGFNRTTVFSLADVTTPWAGEIQNSPTPEIISWTEPWWQMVRHAALESKRLGMDFGMFNGPSYESSGGPWISAENSMQQVCFSQTPVTGGSEINVDLPRPKVDPRAVEMFPVYNPNTGLVEKPEIPERNTYFRDIAVLAMPAEGAVTKDQILDLSTKLAADGKLSWNAPAGNWVIYRFGHTTMGTLIQPAQWKATGFECDKMSRKAVEFHMNHVVGEIQKHIGDLMGTVFTHVHFDSYEAGVPDWTPLMREDFRSRRGYDLTPFLATFAGRTVGSTQESDKFRSDFNETIKDLYNDNYFTIIQKTLHEAKLEFLCEPYGGPWRQDEIMPKVDRVMTEFWTGGGRYGPYEVDSTIAALRKSGQNIVEAEAFTGIPGDSQWSETPEWLKPIGDAAYCAGINRFVLHRFPQQPWDERYLPGATMGQWGTHFDRTQTWWKPGKAMVSYWQRCQALLQWGRFVVQPEDFSIFRAQGKIAVKSIHRRAEQTDVYFIANTERAAGSAWCGFGVTEMQPELWDPVTGTTRALSQFEVRDGKTLVPLDFAPAQSFFIVFRKPAEPKTTPAQANFPALTPQTELTGEWQVSFDPKWGGPSEPVRFEKLEDWTQRAEPGIKYYSGTAVYRKNFDVSVLKSPYQLDLGTVHCIARVKLNGKDLGVVWCAPWSISLPPDSLQMGSNQLEIEITNVWANRLIGDEQEPADCEWLPGHMGGSFLKRFPEWFLKNEPRPSKGRFCFTTWNYFTKESPLAPSGLLGPVRLMTEDWAAGVKPPLPPGPEAFSNEQILSDPKAPLIIAAETDPVSGSGLESGLLRGNLLAPDLGATIVDESYAHDGGGTNAEALRNGTTRNGAGGAETRNDGKTFRGYGQNNAITFRLDTAKNPQGYDLTNIATFAGHFGGRASQSYRVLIAHVGDPSRFVQLAEPALSCDGAASKLRLTARDKGILDNGAGVQAKGVAAVRFEFHDGPIGFNVYREIQVTGTPVAP